MGSLTGGPGEEAVDPAWLAQVTAGQRWVVAGLVTQFLVFKTLEPRGGIFIELLVWSLAFGCCWVGTAKIATALKLGAGARVAMLLSVGCASFLGYAYLFLLANSKMRPRGYQLGFFGASKAFDTARGLQDAVEAVPQAQRRSLELSFEQASRSRQKACVLSFCLGTMGVDRFYPVRGFGLACLRAITSPSAVRGAAVGAASEASTGAAGLASTAVSTLIK